MPYDNNGNFVENCGDQCISNRFAKDSGKDAAIEMPAPTLCGMGCGAYADDARGSICAKCIKEKGLESLFQPLDEKANGDPRGTLPQKEIRQPSS